MILRYGEYMNLPGKLFLIGVTCWLTFAVMPALHANQAEEPPGDKPPKLFESDEPLTIRLVAPWRDFQRKKTYQGSYPATLSWTDPTGTQHTVPLTVERRGRTRQEVCSFPPIKLRFDKPTVKGTVFRGQSSLKMVTHCDRSSRYMQYYIKEMLAYKMYNLITDFSFRVRRLSVFYDNGASDMADESEFSFLIEDDKDVAKRNDQKKLKINKATVAMLDPAVTSHFILFQFMIGNLDWSALSGPGECCHNSKLIGLDPQSDPVYPLPYDFDASGLVNAHYAVAPESLPVRSVRDRLYRGFCAQSDFVEQSRQKYLSAESEILALIETEPLLDKYARRNADKYMREFFDRIRNVSKFEAETAKRCRG